MTTLNLNPWKDGTKITWSLLDQNPGRIKAVRIQFDDNELKQDAAENDLVAMFEGVGSELPNLEHLHVHLQVSIQSPLSSRAFPPIQGLTSLLMEANGLKSLSLTGLALLSGDYEMRGLVESLRIHPSLQSFEMKDCTFLNDNHLQNLKEALANIPSLKHSDLLNNAIARAPIQEPSLAFRRRLGLLILFLGLCILVCAVLLVSQPTYRTAACKLYNSHLSAVFQVPLTCASSGETPKKFWQRVLSRNKRR
jgi:hypothetical protein